MGQKFAKVIIDISHQRVDRIFDYKIPEALWPSVQAGVQVSVPFGKGNVLRKGYVVEVADQVDYDVDKVKEVVGVRQGAVQAESHLIKLAWWMKERYGSTMNQALKTVLPVRQKVKAKEKKALRLLLDGQALQAAIQEGEKKGYQARVRLLKALKENPLIPYEVATRQMNLSPATLKPMVAKGQVALEAKAYYRNPVKEGGQRRGTLQLNEKQQEIVDVFSKEYQAGLRRTYLIHGITGSGKTEVYMELIQQVMEDGKQVILLIPEIALTYQTVMRFYSRFGDRVSIINSRLSQGERFDQFERARQGEIDMIIGPRSALFTPFANLGLVIIDEEHEGAYKSEVAPRYHAREVAEERARMSHASLVLGSATPSLESYGKAMKGEYQLFCLEARAKADSHLAKVQVVDLREELKEGNKSIFSRSLQALILNRLERKEQAMLFINRRGYANFVSCRSCGEAVRCPHCDVTLTLHNNGQLKCHYCGYAIPMPERCPSCGSPYIGGFGVGTQKIEEMAKRMFPQARILRMDLDTTSKKGGHEEILSAFAQGRADILIGTQMIVKGHDFPQVTLVGVLAADLSLNTPDFRCAERTFQLLTQAAGRAGRGQMDGEVVIQTYNPEHYSIVAAAAQDYVAFYRQEMAYRSLMKYPPVSQLLTIQLSSRQEEQLACAMGELAKAMEDLVGAQSQPSPSKTCPGPDEMAKIQVIGPVDAPIYKLNDIYRKILYMKHENYDILIKIKNQAEEYMEKTPDRFSQVLVQYDFA